MNPLEQLKELLPQLEKKLLPGDSSTIKNLVVLFEQENICPETWKGIRSHTIPALKGTLYKTDVYCDKPEAKEYFAKAISLMEEIAYLK